MRMMCRLSPKIWPLPLIAVLSSALTVSCFLLPKEEALLPPPLIEPPKISYRTLKTELGNMERRIVVSGSIVYPTQLSLKFGERSGTLKEVRVKLGDEVTTGQALATLDTDSLRLDVERQRIRLRRAEISLERTKATESDRFQQEISQLDVQLAQLSLEQLETELEKSTVRSPINGEVVFVTRILPGETIGARQTVVQVADPTDVLFSYRGRRNEEFSTGRKVNISLGKNIYPGVVVMTPRTTPLDAPREVLDVVLIRIEAPFNELTRGQSGTASIVTDQRKNVIVLPSNAVKTYLNRRFVFVLEDGLRTERTVEVGLSTSTQTEIVEGLSVGEEVVLR